MILGSVLTSVAQDVQITGRVTTSAGAPAEGTSVTVKGTSRGTATKRDGTYAISGKIGETLVFSGIGYTTKEVLVESATTNVVLELSAGNLGELVVVGYATQKRSNITSAVSTVKGEDLIKRPLASTSMALQGFAPGLVIQQGSGQPGVDGGAINIRGIGSITGSSAPLIIVDGVEQANINDIDPNVIESISILKDAASTSIYGVRGTNGVILIKTRRGQNGTTSIAYNGFFGQQTPTNFPRLLSSVDHMILENENSTNAGGPIIHDQTKIDIYRNNRADNLNIFDTDWRDLIFQNSGLMQNHNIIVSGGSEKASYLISGTMLDQQGLVVNNKFKRYDLRMNGDVNLTKKIKFSSDFFYTNSTNLQPAGMSPNEIIQRGISLARIFPGKFGPEQYGDAGQSNRVNPVGAAESSGFNQAQTPTLSMRFGLSGEIFKNFFVDLAYNNRSSYTQAYEARATYDVFNPNPASNDYTFAQSIGDSALTYTNIRESINQYNLSGNYSFDINDDHEFKILAGFQAIDVINNSISAGRQGLPDPSRPYLNLAPVGNLSNSGGAFDNALAGFFGRLNYSFQQKYLLELNYRRDGASRFSRIADKQWGGFAGASAGWILTREKFMENVTFLNFFKLRASYGATGNQALGGTANNNYPFIAIINPGNAYYFNNTLTAGSALGSIPNESLSWETSTQANIGFDASVLNNKLSVTFDVYRKKIDDALMAFPVALAQGYTGSSTIPSNAASFVNNGWEFSTTYRNKAGKLNYSITGNLSDVTTKTLNTRGRDIVNGNRVTREGFPLFSYLLYLTDGLYQVDDDFSSPTNATRTTGPGDIKYVDVNRDGEITPDDRVLLGNNFPRFDYSLNLNADYKGFDLNVFLFGVGKRDNYISGVAVQPFNAGNWFSSGLVSALDRWTPTNTNAQYPRLFSGGNNNYISSDFWLRNGAFMRIKHITLGYTLNKAISDKMGIKQLRFYVNTVNPFTFSDYEPGFDPEISNTNGSFYPIMRTTTVGVNLKF